MQSKQNLAPFDNFLCFNFFVFNSEFDTWFFDDTGTSLTRLGDLWKFLTTIFHSKVAQSYGDSFGLFENINFQVKTTVSTFGATFRKISATLHFSIWSHWLVPLALDDSWVLWLILLNFFIRSWFDFPWKAEPFPFKHFKRVNRASFLQRNFSKSKFYRLHQKIEFWFSTEQPKTSLLPSLTFINVSKNILNFGCLKNEMRWGSICPFKEYRCLVKNTFKKELAHVIISLILHLNCSISEGILTKMTFVGIQNVPASCV